ncbi:MAG: PAS domain S-box protein [Thermodesulfobacteriota bacterium]
MKKFFSFFFTTLRGRLIVGVAVVHAVMMTLFIADVTMRQRAMLLAHQIREATALSHSLATSTAGWLAADDLAGLQEIVEAQLDYPEILFVILADESGRVLACSDTSRRGQYLQDLPVEIRQTVFARVAALVDVATPAMVAGRHVGWARVGIGQQAAREQLAVITRDGILYAGAAIAIGAVIAWLMGRRLTRRLYVVQKTIAAVRAGDPLARAHLAGEDEAAVMARECNNMLDVIAAKEAELREKTEELDRYFSDALDLLCIADCDGHFLRVNREWEVTLGIPLAQIEGRRFLDFIHGDDLPATEAALADLVAGREVRNFVNRYRHRDGQYRWIEWRAFQSGRRIYAVARDITERKLAEDALRDLNRELRAISSCNQILMRAEDEQYLLDEICRIICEEAGYIMVWVGFAEDDEEKTIRPVALAGRDDGYLDGARISWADTEQGGGPSGTAVRAGQTVYVQDMATDPRMALWRESALQRGYRSSIAIPLRNERQEVFGVLNIYAARPDAFSPEEVRLLEELAGDLAFGITVLRARIARKEAQQQIALLGFALDSVQEAAFLIDGRACFHYVNEESCRMLGYRRDELLSLGVADVDPDFPVERWEQHWQELRRRGSLTFEGRHRARNGSVFPVEINANYFEYDGRAYNLALVRNISERKQAETERLANLHFFASMDRINRIIGGTGDLEAMLGNLLDAALNIFACDRAWLLHPCDPEEAHARVVMEKTTPPYPGALSRGECIAMEPDLAAAMRLALEQPGPLSFGEGGDYPMPGRGEERFGIQSAIHLAIRPKRGKPWLFGLHQCARPRLWSEGEKRLFHEIGIRLTDGITSLLAYRDLQESENKLAEAQRIAHIGSWELDLQANHLSWSDEIFRIFEIDRDNFPGTYEAFLQVIHPDDRDLVHHAYQQSVANRTPYFIEHRLLFADGRIKYVHERCETCYDAEGNPLRSLGTVQDITESKLAQVALRQSEEFIRTVLDTVDEGFIVVGRDYRIVSANKAFCAMVDGSEDEIVGRHCHEITHCIGQPCFETGEQCPVQAAFAEARPQSTTHVHPDAAGKQRFVELKAFPVLDEEGKVTSVIETINDVTEKRKLEEQFRQAQKMEAVGRLAGGVAHDFNNMIGVIMGNTELALLRLESDHPLHATLQVILKAAGRSADLTRQLLAFARKQTVTPRVLDLNTTMEGMLKILRRLIGEDINLVWQPGKGLWLIRVDPSQIDQILANLCVNARDAIAGVGRITIETGNAVIDESACADHPEATPGDYVRLTVSDTGSGMERATINQIFEPFFTTKELGKGTGLGLATVYGIVRQNKGFITVRSEPGLGSTFTIYLPRHSAGPVGPPEKIIPFTLPGGTETILLAEDEKEILAMVRQALEGFGYRVLAAATPQEALRFAETHEGKIDLLMTDVVMPEMNGRELAERLLAIQPGIPCLFMSGYTGDILLRQGVVSERDRFIEKPFSIQALAEKVREVLDDQAERT